VHRGKRAADPSHPFGYGQERYFWSLLAAFGIFVAGGGFSIFEGILALGHEGSGDLLIAYIALALAGVAEGTSLIRAYSQMRAEARRDRTGIVEHVQRSPDTTVKAALFEDIAAMIGLVLAAAGLVLRQLTGSGVWDAAASMAIGVLLIVVAVKLGIDSRDLLIGRAAGPEEQQTIREEIEQTPGVDALIELLTMQLGPDHLLVAARVDFSGDINADEAEDLASRIDRQLAERLSVTSHVFIDPTRKGGQEDAQTAPEASSPR
jgi:cation diffusion facilitator family transporter